jgi:flagellar biosynthesis anti-sigma factor FlgM
MRIDPNNIPSLASQQNRAADKTAKRAEEAVRQDGGGATLSLNAAAISSLTSPSAAPDIRNERVQALKAAVDSNTYKPQPEKIADSMLSALSNWR